MKFELRAEYPDWEGNTRKALHVDMEALLVLKNDDASQIPEDVLVELKKPMYQGHMSVSAMTVLADL